MKVLVTGSRGFIGKNLLVHLREIEGVEIVEYDTTDEFEKIANQIDKIDVIYHFAGANRPTTTKEFYTVNTDLTKELIDLLNKNKKSIPFIFSSSIQASLDNDYGRSKKQAEDYIIENYNNHHIYRFNNVFGKWCRPNYNSVVATFCYNIANDIEIKINDENHEIDLIYIDDICYSLLRFVDNDKVETGFHYIEPVKKINLKELASLIYSFKDSMNSIFVPKTGDEFVKKLYSTYISYVPIKETVVDALTHEDERGSFTELVKTIDSGQFSVSYSKPGIVRGNHYHNTKVERFIVIKGQARINFESVVDSTDQYSFEVRGSKIQLVTIPVGYTHNIENIGDDEMILFIWCNELFDKDKPDTYFKKLK